jgi:hypothetical protein
MASEANRICLNIPQSLILSAILSGGSAKRVQGPTVHLWDIDGGCQFPGKPTSCLLEWLAAIPNKGGKSVFIGILVASANLNWPAFTAAGSSATCWFRYA